MSPIVFEAMAAKSYPRPPTPNVIAPTAWTLNIVAKLKPPSDDEYLKLHGARRGLSAELYREKAELVQEVLRHKSVETTTRRIPTNHADSGGR